MEVKQENEDIKEDLAVGLHVLAQYQTKRQGHNENSENKDAADLNRDRSDEEERSQGNTRHKALDQPVERNVSLP